MSATDTLPRSVDTGTDTPDWTHVTCCAGPPVSLCGVDLTSADEVPNPGPLPACPLCEALLAYACPRCGA